MQLDPTLLAGPIGALAVLVFVVYQFSTGKWVARERLDEKERDRKELSLLLDKSLDGAEATAKAIEERNRMEAARIEGRRQSSPGLAAGLLDAEHRIARR